MWRASYQDGDPIAKVDGDCWLDCPLVTSEGEVLGKITLGCDQQLSPQEFSAFSVLSAWFANVLAAMRDRIERAKQRWVVEAAELSMTTMAHNMNTQFAPLGLILAKYRRKESSWHGAVELNNQFASVYGALSRIALEANDKLGVVKISPVHFDLLQTLREVLSTNLSDGQWVLTCSAEEARLEADDGKLRDVIVELLYNAQKHVTPRESLFMEVTVRIGDGEIEVLFQDNGRGVPNEIKERIFDNFFHTYTGRGDDHGQGLGLNWARRVMEAHGGTLVEKGKLGNGACFVACIPVKPIKSDVQNAEERYVSIFDR